MFFFLQLLPETFLTLRRFERHMIENVHCPSRVVPVNLVQLITGEFSGQVFEKYSNIKFQENPSSEGGLLHED